MEGVGIAVFLSENCDGRPEPQSAITAGSRVFVAFIEREERGFSVGHTYQRVGSESVCDAVEGAQVRGAGHARDGEGTRSETGGNRRRGNA